MQVESPNKSLYKYAYSSCKSPINIHHVYHTYAGRISQEQDPFTNMNIHHANETSINIHHVYYICTGRCSPEISGHSHSRQGGRYKFSKVGSILSYICKIMNSADF